MSNDQTEADVDSATLQRMSFRVGSSMLICEGASGEVWYVDCVYRESAGHMSAGLGTSAFRVSFWLHIYMLLYVALIAKIRGVQL